MLGIAQSTPRLTKSVGRVSQLVRFLGADRQFRVLYESTPLPIRNNPILSQFPCAKIPPQKTAFFPRKDPKTPCFVDLKTPKTHLGETKQQFIEHRKTPIQTAFPS
jgi:hypothetical protein